MIASSSRGGSSFLFSLLRRTGHFVSLPGEHAHLYKLYGLTRPVDVIAHDGDVDLTGDLDGFAADLFSGCSRRDFDGAANPTEFEPTLLAALAQQWPFIADRVEEVRPTVKRLVKVASGRVPFDHDGLLLTVVMALRKGGYPIDPWYYDMSAVRIVERFPSLIRPHGPPNVTTLVEEPPFVVPRPSVSTGPSDVNRRPLLLKASIDAYRLDVIRTLFPAADVRVVHLLRNPAAAVNGLMDGWLDRGFYSHNVTARQTLAITGYSHLPWGRSWWNFDLPPGWRAVADRPLIEVCATQWRSAHESILDSLGRTGLPTIRVRAEDLFLRDRRQAALRRVMRFAGVPDSASGSLDLPPVMATALPRPARWRARYRLLRAAVAAPEICALSDALGYGSRPDEGWV